MFDTNNHFSNMQLRSLLAQEPQYDAQTGLMIAAHNLFRETVWRGQLYRLGAAIFHRPRQLLDLESVKPHLRPGSVHYCGVKAVPLRQIVGTEGRSSDFDFTFHPMYKRSEQRWMSVAAAYFSGMSLPPVELIQVGKAYFVRDGHHRVSVTRALRRDFIDAEIIAWDLCQGDSLEPVIDLLAGLALPNRA